MHPAHISNSIRKSLRVAEAEAAQWVTPMDLATAFGHFMGDMDRLAKRIDEGLGEN